MHSLWQRPHLVPPIIVGIRQQHMPQMWQALPEAGDLLLVEPFGRDPHHGVSTAQTLIDQFRTEG
jgi:hypothetical protein